MRKIFILIIATCGLLSYLYFDNTIRVEYNDQDKSQKSFLSKEKALQKLKDGNLRYTNNNPNDHQFRNNGRKYAVEGQSPSVFILSCMDSRSIPEIIFDQTAGSLFVSRVAGNVVDTMMLASMEYAAYVGTKLFVIMGHTQCGAIDASCNDIGFGNIHDLVAKIQPAVSTQKNLDCSAPESIHSITSDNIDNNIRFVINNSKFLKEKLDNGDISIIGAIHNIKTGEVNFLNGK